MAITCRNQFFPSVMRIEVLRIELSSRQTWCRASLLPSEECSSYKLPFILFCPFIHLFGAHIHACFCALCVGVCACRQVGDTLGITCRELRGQTAFGGFSSHCLDPRV